VAHKPAMVLAVGMILVAGTSNGLSATGAPPERCAARQTVSNQLRHLDCRTATIGTSGVGRSIAPTCGNSRPSHFFNSGGHPLSRAFQMSIQAFVVSAFVVEIPQSAFSTTSRVRSSDSALAGLIDHARRGSETFRRLLTTIQGSNGIVYVEPGECGHGVRACLKIWMQVVGPNRFVRIAINRSKTDRDVQVMGSLGHELQHAIEVLSEPAVTNGVTMFNFLKRTAPTDSNRFETTAAVNAGNAVIDELMDQRAAR
jgi:hypothetical protein